MSRSFWALLGLVLFTVAVCPAATLTYTIATDEGLQNGMVSPTAAYTVTFNNGFPGSNFYYSGGHIVTGTDPTWFSAPVFNNSPYLLVSPSTEGTNSPAPTLSPVFITFDPGVYVRYFGLHISSLDRYNVIEFWRGNQCVSRVRGARITGVDNVNSAADPVTENCDADPQRFAQFPQTRPTSAFYLYPSDPQINTELLNSGFAEWRADDPSEYADMIILASSDVAFESDNHGFETTTPEPATWAMLGAGIATLAVLRRRKR